MDASSLQHAIEHLPDETAWQSNEGTVMMLKCFTCLHLVFSKVMFQLLRRLLKEKLGVLFFLGDGSVVKAMF